MSNRWKRRLRWFASELVVVVVGILVALSLNAWWAGRADRSDEMAYLAQLREDLRTTEATMAKADSSMRQGPHRALTLLLRSFGTASRPPRDSLLSWLHTASWVETPRPVLGTAEALVSSGSLRLIRDDSLRTAITTYFEKNEELLELQASILADWSRFSYVLSDRHDFSQTRLASPESTRTALAEGLDVKGLVPLGGWVSPFPLDVDRLYRDRLIYSAIRGTANAAQGLAFQRRRMGETALELRRHVEKEVSR